METQRVTYIAANKKLPKGSIFAWGEIKLTQTLVLEHA